MCSQGFTLFIETAEKYSGGDEAAIKEPEGLTGSTKVIVGGGVIR